MSADLASKNNNRASRSAIVVTKIIQFMSKMNVAPLPRNYELFYEVLSGHNPAMGREILALGNAPQQHDLDEIGLKHNLAGHGGMTAGKAASEISRTIEQISHRLAVAVQRTGTLLDQAETNRDVTQDRDYLSRLTAELQAEQASLHHFVKQGLETMRECEANIEKARHFSLRDPLTTLPNRAAFAEKLSTIFVDGQAQAAPSLIVLNIDSFHHILENYGAAAGNRALRRLAALFRKSVKKHDFVARTGANEFSFLFSEVPLNAAENIADRLRRTVEGLRFMSSNGPQEKLTVSIGVATVDGATSAAEFYGHGELALLAARCRDGNCVVPYSRAIAKRTRSSYLMELGH